VVKSFVRERYEEEKFKKANIDLKESTMKAMKIVIFTIPAMSLAMNITILAVVWFGGKQIIAGSMTSGVLTAFVNYVIQILISLVMVSFIILNSSRTLASVRRINEVLDTDIDLTDENAVYKDKTVEYGKSNLEKFTLNTIKTMKNGFWKISTS